MGVGENFSRILTNFFHGIACFIFSFFGSWKLTLTTLTFTPIWILLGIILNKLNVKGNTLVRQTWEIAGGIGEEIFYNIKTVSSFANFEYELKRFYEKVEISNRIELVTNFKIKLIQASFFFLQGIIILFVIVYGRTLIGKDHNSFAGRDLTGGDISLTFVNVVRFESIIYPISLDLRFILMALASSSDYFNLYERKPEMDLTNSIEKPSLSEIKGKIEFHNVKFYYPSDNDKKFVLNGMNLNF